MPTASLKDLTDAELRQELQSRETVAREAAKPMMIVSPNLKELRKACQAYIDHLENEGVEPNYGADYIYRVALITFFGQNIFDWIDGAIG